MIPSTVIPLVTDSFISVENSVFLQLEISRTSNLGFGVKKGHFAVRFAKMRLTSISYHTSAAIQWASYREASWFPFARKR